MTPLVSPLRGITRDDVLARRVARGDDEAFALLFGRYQPRIETYCRSILRHDEDARDAAQNTMACALVALRRGDRANALRPWLYRIAHNEAISVIRRRRPEAELDDRLPDLTTDPAAQAALRAELVALLGAIDDLAPRARHALLLRELGDLSHAEIGVVLEISENAARQAVFQARSALVDDRAGRESPCGAIREELSALERRRVTRRVRGHLRDCGPCRDWRAAQRRRREALALLPVGPAAGTLWVGLAGLLGLGGGTTAVGGVTMLGTKTVTTAMVMAVAAAPVALQTRRHDAPQPRPQPRERVAQVTTAADGDDRGRPAAKRSGPARPAATRTAAPRERVERPRTEPRRAAPAERTGTGDGEGEGPGGEDGRDRPGTVVADRGPADFRAREDRAPLAPADRAAQQAPQEAAGAPAPGGETTAPPAQVPVAAAAQDGGAPPAAAPTAATGDPAPVR